MKLSLQSGQAANPTGYRPGSSVHFVQNPAPYLVIGEDDDHLWLIHMPAGEYIGVMKTAANLTSISLLAPESLAPAQRTAAADVVSSCRRIAQSALTIFDTDPRLIVTQGKSMRTITHLVALFGFVVAVLALVGALGIGDFRLTSDPSPVGSGGASTVVTAIDVPSNASVASRTEGVGGPGSGK